MIEKICSRYRFHKIKRNGPTYAPTHALTHSHTHTLTHPTTHERPRSLQRCYKGIINHQNPKKKGHVIFSILKAIEIHFMHTMLVFIYWQAKERLQSNLFIVS